MKEISCDLVFSEELLERLNKQMDEYGRIIFEGCDDALVEVMPIDKKNFISEVHPIVSLVLSFGSQIAMGLLVNWLYDVLKENKILVIAGRTVKVETKEDVSKVIEEVVKE